MGQSLVQNYLHFIFSTKHHRPLIYPPYEEELYQYLGGICKKLECHPIKVGGHRDHVHILCMLSKKVALMKLLEKLKSNCSKWMKTNAKELEQFFWQDGYGAFSVNPSQVGALANYIPQQHKHHHKKSFKEEYLAFLKKYNVEYDERFVWD